MARTTPADNTATDPATAEVTRRANPGQLRELSSFEQAMQLAQEVHGEVVSAPGELGDGFALFKDADKMQLVGVKLVVLEWSFSPGDYEHELCTMRIVTEDGRKIIANDGSTGIANQLREFQDRTGRTGGLYVPRGFRVSEYENEKTKEGRTFYLDTSA